MGRLRLSFPWQTERGRCEARRATLEGCTSGDPEEELVRQTGEWVLASIRDGDGCESVDFWE